MSFPTNGDGTQRPFNADEYEAMDLRTTGVKDGSNPTIGLGTQGSTIRREWFCNWDQKENAACALLGRAAVYTDGSGLKISRVMPFYVPGYPKYPAIEIENITGALSAGRDDSKQVPAYKCAKLLVRHELVWFNLAADDPEQADEKYRYVEPLPSTTETTYLTLPGSMLKYRSTLPLNVAFPEGVPIPYNIGRPETVTKRAYKWHRVPRDAWNTTSALYKRLKGDPVTGTRGFVGTVNKTPIFGMPIGTMLFEGVDEEIIPDPMVETFGYDGSPGIGDYAFNLTIRFAERTHGSDFGDGAGWNFLFWNGAFGDGTNAGYYQAIRNALYITPGSVPDGKCLFDERDHNLIFSPG